MTGADSTVPTSSCACCGTRLQWQGDYAQCRDCGLWQSLLLPGILDAHSWQQLDESARSEALRDLRQQNFVLLLARLQSLRAARGSLLDIGAAHGWFVQQAKAAGYDSSGLEPDPRLAHAARQEGSHIREGFFPAALAADERFDVLVFNDVFEHLPDPTAALQACAHHLNHDGLLVLNLPLASGFFFRLSWWLSKLGMQGPWQRLWQCGFPSPHLYFYRGRHLQRMATAAGFTLIDESALPSMHIKGLWARMRMDRQQPLWVHALVWPLLVVLAPFVRLLPNDIGLLIFRLNTRSPT